MNDFSFKEAEGGCGVIGIASTKPIKGKHLLPALCQMDNRGNGKGGGIAAVGLHGAVFDLSQEDLDNYTLLAIAYLDESVQAQVEEEFIHPIFDIFKIYKMPHIADYRTLNLPLKPPEVVLYFVRVKKMKMEEGEEEEIIYQNSYRLNSTFYSGSKYQAFVLSHGKNMLVLKLVGFGQDVIQYYQLEDFLAHVWIGHHRYPTKGKVWHPGGAHPFVGLNEALVHNGDFANYSSLCETLSQRKIYPLFSTDTEVAAYLFDLYSRTYKYPLEYVIEALAPTTERDFSLLSQEKQKIYHKLQTTHIHGSPDGPWFFLIAESLCHPEKATYRLIGITDTSMLRPQVFALAKGEIGLAASEKQAIDACLKSIHEENSHIPAYADHYWNARGGSHTDGGAFSFTVTKTKKELSLQCSDKFGRPLFQNNPPEISSDLKRVVEMAKGDLEKLTQLLDNPPIKSGEFNTLVNQAIVSLLLAEVPSKDLCLNAEGYAEEGENSLALKIVEMAERGFKRIIIFNCHGHRFIGSGLARVSHKISEQVGQDVASDLLTNEREHCQIDKASAFESTDGAIDCPNCSRVCDKSGLSKIAHNVHIEVYGSSGDYLASGIDRVHITVHGSAQDQLGQIMKGGTLVVYGDVGQTFMYGAKGGVAFVKGNAAGRPLINAVGKTKAIINGTCLDYLGESFMAGDPLQGGGFIILNGLYFDETGEIQDLEIPYPGSNLFSLASGGALYIRDPLKTLCDDQLNGAKFSPMTPQDWKLIIPYLEENALYFNISVKRLLQHQGKILPFEEIYRKIIPMPTHTLDPEATWVLGRTKT